MTDGAMTDQERNAVFMGGESLLIQCAELWLERGGRIAAVVSHDQNIQRWAARLEIPCSTTAREFLLTDYSYDYFFSVANLKIVATELLQRSRCLSVNFHDGWLPDYAGLNAPVWSLLNNETEHGVSWHVMLPGVDEGDIISQMRFPIESSDTALTLNTKCYEAGIETFTEVVSKVTAGSLDATKQDLSQRTYYAKAKKPDFACAINFQASAEEVSRLVRALDHGTYRNPVGRAKVVTTEGVVLVGSATVVDTEMGSAEAPVAGTVLGVNDRGFRVACSAHAVDLNNLTDFSGAPLTGPQALKALSQAEGDSLLLPSALAEQIAKVNAEVAKSEDYWRVRLARFSPNEVFLATSTKEAGVPVDVPGMPGDTLLGRITNLALWLNKTSSSVVVHLGLRLPQKGVEAVGHLFGTTVPFELDFAGVGSLVDAQATVKEALDRAMARPAYPRDLYARGFGLAQPTFPVVVALGPVDSLDHGTVLSLEAETGHLRADSNALGAAAIELITQQLSSLAESLSSPAMDIACASLLSSEERQRLLVDFNQTAIDYPKHLCVHQLVEEQVRKTPDHTALVYEGQSLTYLELNQRANQLANKLQQRGAGTDQLVGLCVDRTPDLVIGALAIQKAGAAYVPLDPSYPSERIRFMLEDSQAKLVVTQSQHSAMLSSTSCEKLELDTLASELSAQSGDDVGTPVRPGQLAYVIYTSGSTGKPKGVLVEHGNVNNFFVGMDARIARDREKQQAWLAVTSLSFDISVLEIFWTLSRGFKVVLASEERLNVAGEESRSARPIEFSLFYFASDAGENADDKYRLLLEGAKFGDEHGFSAVWTPERHFGAFGGLYPNPAVSSAALATITKNVQLRAGSCVIPLHHPVRIAEEWALVDNLSNGRVGISFAAGWHPNDFCINKENFKEKKAVMLENIETVRALWRGERRTFEGPVGPVEVQTLPRPIQRELPFWLTAAGNPETFAAAGRTGANLLTHLLGQSLEELEGKLKVYRDAWKAAGHEGSGHVSLMLHTYVGTSEEQTKQVVREPMKQYLKSSIQLIAAHAWSFPAFKKSASEQASFEDNFTSMSEEDMDGLLDFAFERYYETSGLFGTVENCEKTVERLKRAGIDDVACLIDFGVPTEVVLESLPRLNCVRQRAEVEPELQASDFSLSAQLVRHSVTHLQCTPSMARMVLSNDLAKESLSQLQCVMVGGEALSLSLAGEIKSAASHAKLLNMYGPTETTIWSSTDLVEPTSGCVTIGRPIANTQLYVLDKAQQPVPVGVPGELYIGGDGVARGYHQRPELTAQRFVENPFGKGRIYRTGDLVRHRRDGRIDYIGRVDHQVKVRGYRIELGEIEAKLNQVAGISESVVVVREDQPGDPRLVAYYIEGAPVDAMWLREQLAEVLPAFMLPSHLLAVESFPLTPNAKVDRKALPSPQDLVPKARVEYVEPSNDKEVQIAEVWKRMLGVEQVGSADNFFDLGGHSLLAVRAHRELTTTLGAKLSITDIFRYPTLGALAEFLGEGQGQAMAEKVKETSDRVAARRAAMQRRRGARTRP